MRSFRNHYKMILHLFCVLAALDWGGVRREWFELLSTELFEPERTGLFKRLQSDNQGLVSITVLHVDTIQ